MNGALGSSLLLTTTGACTSSSSSSSSSSSTRDAAAGAASTCCAHPMTSKWMRRTATTTPQREWGWRSQARRRGRTLVTCQLQLKPPPYPLNALEPHMSKETLECHWGRHHRHHLDSLNALIAGTELDDTELEDIVLASYNRGNPQPTFIHAAQIWNHDFFWESMKPGGGGKPSGRLMELIVRDFGSFDKMLQEFTKAASTQIGSGWAWLAYKANRLDVANATNPCPSDEDNKLVIHKTPNAVNPLVWDYSPLLAIDVWEHAYYLDYESRRADYVSVFLEKLVSWEVVSSRLDIAIARATERARTDEKRGQEDDIRMADREAMEMYLDSENEDSETE